MAIGRSGIFALVCVGCGATTVDQTLDEIRGFSTLEVLLDQRAGHPPVRLVVGYTPREPDDCPRLGPETRAFVDEHALSEVSRGFADDGSLLDDGTTCSHPAFVMDGLPPSLTPEAPRATFSIRDSSTTWRVTIDHPFRRRGYSISSPAQAEVGGGDEVKLAWSPDTDHLSYPTVRLVRDQVAIAELVGLRGEVTLTEGVVSFAVPSGLAPGLAQLDVSVGVDPGISECSAGVSCGVGITIEAPIPITLR